MVNSTNRKCLFSKRTLNFTEGFCEKQVYVEIKLYFQKLDWRSKAMKRGCTLKSHPERQSFEKWIPWRKIQSRAGMHIGRRKKARPRDFPGGPVVKNMPANSEDTGLIPSPWTSHMPQGKEARVPHTCNLKPVLYSERSHHNEKLTQAQPRVAPAHHN